MSIQRTANWRLIVTVMRHVVVFSVGFGAVFGDVFSGWGRVVAIAVAVLIVVALAVAAGRGEARQFEERRERDLYEKTIAGDVPLPADIDLGGWKRHLLLTRAEMAPWRVPAEWLGFFLSLTVAMTVAQRGWAVDFLAIAMVLGCGFGAVVGQIEISQKAGRSSTVDQLLHELDARAAGHASA